MCDKHVMSEILVEKQVLKRLKVENGSDENGNDVSEKEYAPQEKIRLGSRKSQLALFQTNYVADLLRKQYVNISYDIVSMFTTGDKILDIALSKIGEKGLFTKELEVALERKDVHMVVHSLKDLPTTLPPNMVIGAICKRENPFDVVVFSPKYLCKDLSDLPSGSVVGTSSLRRVAQLTRLFPDLKFESIRGNLNTRLRKLDEDNTYAALVLAAAGMIRLDLEHRIGNILTPEECMYAVGQGALAIECREDDGATLRLLSKISHKETTLCCVAERALMRKLEGGCSVPIAVHSCIQNEKLTLRGGVFSLDGSRSIVDELSVDIYSEKEAIPKQRYAGIVATHLPSHIMQAAEGLGEDLAKILLSKGASDILKESREKKVALIAPSK